jgi:hypothetical protein
MYLNLRRFHLGSDLHGDWILFVWTRLAVKPLKFLVLRTCLFSRLEPVLHMPKVLELHPHGRVQASGSCGLI